MEEFAAVAASCRGVGRCCSKADGGSATAPEEVGAYHQLTGNANSMRCLNAAAGLTPGRGEALR